MAARLSKTQRKVLDLLRVRPYPTSRRTSHGRVSGACASALVRRGLAEHEGDGLGGYRVKITDAGRAALAQSEGK